MKRRHFLNRAGLLAAAVAASLAFPVAAQVKPNATALDIPGRDHNLAVGDKVHKQGVLEFLKRRP